MAFKMNGKHSRVTPDDVFLLARTLKISQQRAAVLLANCSRRVVNALPDLRHPVANAAGLSGVSTLAQQRQA